MSGRILKCFTVMVHGEFYRKNSRVHTVHAVSVKHAIRLLKQKSGFKLFRTMYVQESHKCDPQSGQPCGYRLVAQPTYGITPDRELAPNSPERPTDRLRQISPEREKIIERMRQRIDVYGPD